MKSVALHNLGCKVNGYEMDYMQQMLQEKGYKIVPFDEKADIYIINTCTVTNIADRKSRQMLHRAKKKNPGAVVVAVGCYVQTGGEQALLDEGIDLAVGNNKKKDLIPILEEFLAAREEGSADMDKTLEGRTVIDISHTCEYESMQLKRTAEHKRAYIKIQDGCNQFCSYCIIPYARGRVRSRKIAHSRWGGGFLFRPLFVCKSSHVSRETSHTLNAEAPWLAFLPFSDISLPSPSLFQYTVDSDTYLNPAA